MYIIFDENATTSKLNLCNDDGITANSFENQKFEKFDFRSKFKNNTLNIKVEYDQAPMPMLPAKK